MGAIDSGRGIISRNAPDHNRTPATGRLAPSPTGGLHLGHARTFLIAWLSARAAGGRVVLRIEDLDAGRLRPEARAGMAEDLAWLGLDWDVGPIYQSDRIGLYQQTLDRLIADEAVYPCTCTRKDILAAASAPHADEEGPRYPGTCADRTAAEAQSLRSEGRSFAWRFRVPEGTIAWEDHVAGPMALDPARQGGDFVVARSSGEWSYQLAVVVDDAQMGITEVVRGADLAPSTPRQLLLFARLGWPAPRYAHVPLVVDAKGHRLAKRDGAIKLATLRAAGVDPRAIVAWAARSCGWGDMPGPSLPSDWIDRFSFATMDATTARVPVAWT